MRRRRYNAFLLYNSNTRTPFLGASSSVEGSMLIISRSTVWLTSCCSGGKTVFEDYINFDGLGLSVPPPGVQENKIHNFCFPLSIDAMCQNWLKLVEKKSRKCLSVNTCHSLINWKHTRKCAKRDLLHTSLKCIFWRQCPSNIDVIVEVTIL